MICAATQGRLRGPPGSHKPRLHPEQDHGFDAGQGKTLLLNANGGDDTVKRMDLMSFLVSIDVHLTKERALGVFAL
eukprot:4776422-Pyramimonas_sp.AAC.1